MIRVSLLYTICACVCFTACIKKNQTTISKTTGYSENLSTAANSNDLLGKLKLIPEYHPAEHVILSSYAIELKDVIENLGYKVVVLTEGKNSSGSEWARDWSPLLARGPENKRYLLDFNYQIIERPGEREEDDIKPQIISSLLNIPRISVPLFLEGGNIMINDDGVCVTTDALFEKQNRLEESYINNEKKLPEKFKSRVDDIKLNRIGNDRNKLDIMLKNYLGCQKIIHLERIPKAVETTGHIDMFAKFIDNKNVVLGMFEEDANPTTKQLNEILERNKRTLENADLTVHSIPLPPLRREKKEGREVTLFRSYTNFLILGKTILMPKYTPLKLLDEPPQKAETGEFIVKSLDDALQDAKKVLSKLKFKVVPIEMEDHIIYGGAIHCLTMQVSK